MIIMSIACLFLCIGICIQVELIHQIQNRNNELVIKNINLNKEVDRTNTLYEIVSAFSNAKTETIIQKQKTIEHLASELNKQINSWD